jgi:putative hydrolase of HD superfamily
MITDFFKTAINLKKIQRQGWIDKLSMNNPESVADHSYSMAIMGMILSDLENYNTEKILKMTLLHDLAESITGDFTPEQISSEEKIKLENSTFEKIIEKLPNIIKMEYEKIWKEYQEGTSDESRLVHQIDKLEMALQAKTYEEEGYSREQISSFLETAEKDIVEPKLKELFRKIIEGE